jgi:hypothetical protein
MTTTSGASGAMKATQDRFKNQDLRKLWQKMKAQAGEELKKFDPDAAKQLPALFDKGLGPLLDKWDQETAKWPNYDAKKLGSIGGEIARVMADYHKRAPGGKAGMVISGALDGIAGELNRRLKWYANPTL